MAQTRKYATLPDLDNAPDVYETTPDLIEDNSTVPEDASQDLDDHASGIDRRHVEARKARTRFETSRVDARQADFSDKLGQKPTRSYRTSHRRRRKRSAESHNSYGDSSDEDDETLDQKLARLRQEIEDVKQQMGEEDDEDDDDDETSEDGSRKATVTLRDVDQVSEMIDSVYKQRQSHIGAEAQYMRAVQRFSQNNNGTTATTSSEVPVAKQNETVTSAAIAEEQAQAWTKIAAFDDRLQAMESALGLSGPTTTDPSTAHKPILPTLARLDRQVTALSASSTVEALNAASLKIRQLGQDAERVKTAPASTAPSTGTHTPSGIHGLGTQVVPSASDESGGAGGLAGAESTKIDALFGTLPTIESLAATLPAVLERLRSLRLIHASAGDASGVLEELGKRQAEQAGELGRWREALRGMEEGMEEGREVLTANVKLVGEWVKDLEARLEELE